MKKSYLIGFIIALVILCGTQYLTTQATVWTQVPVDSNSPATYLFELPVNDSSTLHAVQTSTFDANVCIGGVCNSAWPAGGSGIASTTPWTLQNFVVASGTGIATINATSGTYYPYSNPSSFISTSTGLTTANFATTSISQWNNNSGYITTSSISINGVSGNIFTSLATSSGITAGTCTNCNLTYNANGVLTVAANGSGGAGSVSTSSAISTNNFPFWTSTGGALSGTSTLTSLSNGVNVTGTIYQSGIPLGTAANYAFGDFLASSTSYVSSFNGSTGAITGVNSWDAATGTITVSTSGPLLSISQSAHAITFTTLATSTILSGYATSSGVSAGSCTYCALTVNANGIITAQGNGTPVTSVNGATGAVNAVNTLNGSTGTYNLYATSPLSIATGTASTTISCPTCGTGSGTLTTSTANTAGQIAIGDGGSAIRFSSSFTATTSTGVLAAPTGTFSGTLAVGAANGATSTLYVSGTTNITGTTTIGTATTSWQYFQNGHVNATGTTPQVSSCGTSPTIVGNDAVGTVQVGSVSATGCTITFASAYANNSSTCTVTERTGSVTNALSYTVTSSTIVVSQTGLTSDILDYSCWEHY